MALKRQIIQQNLEDNRNKFIRGGGYVPSDIHEKKKEWTNICLRIRVDFIEEIEKKIYERPGMTKTSWILEAIQEKIRNEKIH